MIVIAHGRGSGKTYDTVQWVLNGTQTDQYPGWTRVMLCHSLHEAQRVREEYPELDYRQVFSVPEWGSARIGSYPVQVAVDNADMVLTSVIGRFPSMVTMTGTRGRLSAEGGE